jgi:hypothetical protein
MRIPAFAYQSESSNTLSMAVGSIHMQIARRTAEKKALQEQIAKLSAELGQAGTPDK